jgi:hypothetical protein
VLQYYSALANGKSFHMHLALLDSAHGTQEPVVILVSGYHQSAVVS